MNGKLRGRRASDDVVRARDHAGHEHDERVVAANGRKCLHDVAAAALSPRAALRTSTAGGAAVTVMVSATRARRELCVDAGRERARDLDPLLHVRTEALSCKGDGVDARTKILDAVLAAAVA